MPSTTVEITYGALVRKADPEYAKQRHRELEYEFTRRKFYGNPMNRGAYANLLRASDTYAPIDTSDTDQAIEVNP